MITSATYANQYKNTGPNTYQVLVHLIDNLNGAYDQWFTVTGATVAQIRDDVTRQIAVINANLSTRDVLAGIAPNAAIPVVLPAPAQVDVDHADWDRRVQRLLRAYSIRQAGANVPPDADLAAFIAGIEADYKAGYL